MEQCFVTLITKANHWSFYSINTIHLNWFMHPVARVSINKYRNLRTQQWPPIGTETCRGKMHTKLCTNICCVRRFLYLLIKHNPVQLNISNDHCLQILKGSDDSV
jgi:hypothetical protein